MALRRAGRAADSRRARRVRVPQASRGRAAPAAGRRCQRRRLRGPTWATAAWGSAPARARRRPEHPPAPREQVRPRHRRATSQRYRRQPAAPASATTRRWQERERGCRPNLRLGQPERERSTNHRLPRPSELGPEQPAGCSTSRRSRPQPSRGRAEQERSTSLRPLERRRARVQPGCSTTRRLLREAAPSASRSPGQPRAEVAAPGGSTRRWQAASPATHRWQLRQAAGAAARSASRVR